MYNEISGLKMRKTDFRPAPPLNKMKNQFVNFNLLRMKDQNIMYYNFIVINPLFIQYF